MKTPKQTYTTEFEEPVAEWAECQQSLRGACVEPPAPSQPGQDGD
jgi:hypothetical protein